MILPEEVEEKSGINVMALYRGAALYYLAKYEFVAEEIQKEYTQLLLHYFEKDFLKMILKDRNITEIKLSGRLRKRILGILDI